MAASCQKLNKLFAVKSLCTPACVRYSTQPPPSFGIPRRIPRWVKHFIEEPTLKPSFQERLAEEAKPRNVITDVKVLIGSDYTIPSAVKDDHKRIWRHRQGNKELERAARNKTLEVSLDEVKDVWTREQGPLQIKAMAEHYGIFRDLFNHAYFYPVVDLGIGYDIDEENVMPVYRGNKISPTEARNPPHVVFESDEDSLWTLLLTNPDGHLTNNDAEYIHWFVGNIPGGDVQKGDVVFDYLQPFPPPGTGSHRHVFILLKQSGKMDYSNLLKPSERISLEDRTFSTCEFLAERQDSLAPMGLAFFQSEHDASVRDVYHHLLDMREPFFEYQHPHQYIAPIKTYPHKEPFDRYYDRYRDKKELAEEVLRLKLSMISPFSEYERPKFPLVHYDRDKPSWIKKKEELMHRRVEQYKDLP